MVGVKWLLTEGSVFVVGEFRFIRVGASHQDSDGGRGVPPSEGSGCFIRGEPGAWCQAEANVSPFGMQAGVADRRSVYGAA
jgi:hypothetical protein